MPPRGRRSPSPDRAPQGGRRTSVGAFHRSAGQLSGIVANGRSATHVVCRLGSAPCPASRPLAWASDGGCRESASQAAASRASMGEGCTPPALHGAVCGTQRQGRAPQGRCGRAALSEVSQGGECGRRGRRRRAAGGLRHQGRAPEAADICRHSRPVRATSPSREPSGRTAPAASRLERDGQAVTSLNDIPGPAAVEGVFMLDYGRGFGGADGAPGG